MFIVNTAFLMALAELKSLLKVKSLGQTAVAVTDHGNMYGTIDFYDECKREGIKAIIGCEVYVAPRSRFDKCTGLTPHLSSNFVMQG